MAIGSRHLRPGDQLPTVRELAVALRINANTVARVYTHLERSGALETRRGVGTFVVDAPDSNGLLHAVSSTLNAQGMRIMACQINTVSGRAHDRFELEPSAQRSLSEAELCDVQLAVFDALPSRG